LRMKIVVVPRNRPISAAGNQCAWGRAQRDAPAHGIINEASVERGEPCKFAQGIATISVLVDRCLDERNQHE
jgi:hypothetical protein